MKEITIKNNFSQFKTEFKADTGLDAQGNMELYIQYFNARMNDKTFQINYHLTHLLLNKLDFLPHEFRLEMAEMIRNHEVIKELVKNSSLQH
jgi:hypothetical protein